MEEKFKSFDLSTVASAGYFTTQNGEQKFVSELPSTAEGKFDARVEVSSDGVYKFTPGEGAAEGGIFAYGATAGSWVITGTDNDDTIVAGNNSKVTGGAGDDSIVVGDNSKVTDVGNGNDFVTTGESSAVTINGDGKFWLNVGNSTEIKGESANGGEIRGGDNVTAKVGVATEGLWVNLGSGAQVTTGSGNDDIFVKDGSTVSTGAGNDYVHSTGANSFVTLGAGTNAATVDGANTYVKMGGASNAVSVGSVDDVTVIGDTGADSVTSGGANAYIKTGSAKEGYVSVGGANSFVTLGGGGTVDGAGATGLNVTGSTGEDSIIVGTDAVVNAGKGKDSILANGTGMVLNGEDDNDEITVAGGENVTVNGGKGDDSVYVAESVTGAVIDLGAGKNYASVKGSGAITGGSDTDSIIANGGQVTITDAGGDNYITVEGASATESTVTLGKGNDSVLIGKDATKVTVNAGDGTNTISVEAAGANITVGKDGDSVYAVDGHITLNLGAGTNYASVGSFSNITAGKDADTILAATDATNVVVDAGDGDNRINVQGASANITVGKGGNSIVAGEHAVVTAGDGSDSVTVGSGSTANVGGGTNYVSVDGASAYIIAGSKADTVRSASEAVTVIAGDGANDISVTGASANITAGAGKDSIVTGDNAVVDSGEGDDSIKVGKDANVTAGAGNDSVYALDNSTVVSAAGNNYVSVGGAGANITLGDGNDTVTTEVAIDGITVAAGAGKNIINLMGATNAAITTGDGADSILAGTKANVVAGDGNDTIAVIDESTVVAAGGNNYITAWTSANITAGSGNDTIVVGKESTVVAGDGNDSVGVVGDGANITAGSGNDTILLNGSDEKVNAGEGKDAISLAAGATAEVTLGAGADTVYFGGAAAVTLSDYNIAEDVIVVDKIGAFSGKAPTTDGMIDTGIVGATSDSITVGEANGHYAVALTTKDGSSKLNIYYAGSNGSEITAEAGNKALIITNTNGDAGDRITGTALADTIIAGSNDLVNAAAGNDAISLDSAATNVTLGFASSNGNDTVSGFKGKNDAETAFGSEAHVVYAYDTALTGVTATVSGGKLVLKDGDASLTFADLNTNMSSAKEAANVLVADNSGKTYKMSYISSGTYADSLKAADIYTGIKAAQLDFSNVDSGLTVDLGNTGVTTDKSLYVNIDGVTGSKNGDNVLIGAAGVNNTLTAGANGGSNTLWGASGTSNDVLVGASGAKDTFIFTSGNGNDTIKSYTGGEDRVNFSNPTVNLASIESKGNSMTWAFADGSSVEIKLDSGDFASKVFEYSFDGSTYYKAYVGKASSTNEFTYSDTVNAFFGGGKGDTVKMKGNDEKVFLDGYSGQTFTAITKVDGSNATGDAVMWGSTGDETLIGGKGTNTLFGGFGASNDVMQGGTGTNTFYFGKGDGKDVITKYNVSTDRIILYNVSVTAGDITSNAPSGSNMVFTLSDGSTLTVQNATEGIRATVAEGNVIYKNGKWELDQ